MEKNKTVYKYTGYLKCDDYIITIETPHKVNPHDGSNEIKIIDPDCATYSCNKFRVKKIENIATNKERESIKTYKKNQVYIFDQKYYINKKIAYDSNFIENKNYQVFLNGCTGEIKTYYECGSLHEIYYHNNGKIEGLYKAHFPNGKLNRTENYINGQLCGESNTYNINGDILYNLNY
jgi:antitoxin component YwqK of YwqJK toxin-antitoxin module